VHDAPQRAIDFFSSGPQISGVDIRLIRILHDAEMRSIPLLVLLALYAQITYARLKTDTVVLVNGNEVTCEILSLSRGVLKAKTDSLSTVSIRWEDVKRVQSAMAYEILLSGASAPLFGALTPDASGKLLLPDSAPIPLLSVVSLTPMGAHFANRFNGDVDFGYNYQKSKSTTQFNFDSDVVYNRKATGLELEVDDTLTLREQTDSTRRLLVTLSVDEALSRANFAAILGQFSNNSELNLIQRYLGGGGFGHYFVRTNRVLLSAVAGGAYSLEHYSGSGRRNEADALLAVNNEVFKLYSPKLDISSYFRLWPSLSEAGRFRIDGNVKVKIELFKDLFVSFSFFDNYDRKNPTTSSPLNDYGVTMSLGYSFNR